MTKKWAEDLNRHSQKNTNRSSNKYVERSSTLLVIVVQLCLTLCNPMDCSMPGPPCSSPSPGTCSNSCPLSQWCHPTILSSVVPFSCLLSFPASGSFPMSQLFASGIQTTGASASASVLPMNIQVWFLCSPCSPRDSQNTTVQKHQFFGTQPSLWSNSYLCTIRLLEKP